MEISKAKHYTMIVAIAVLGAALVFALLAIGVLWSDRELYREQAELQEVMLQISGEQLDQAAVQFDQLEKAFSAAQE